MSDLTPLFINESRRLLSADLSKIEKALDGLSDGDVWWRPNEASNSIGNLVLHLCGNLRQWIIGGVGGRPYERDRPAEFSERTTTPANQLLDRLRAAVAEANEVIGTMTADTLAARRQIQARDVTSLEAIYHVVEHFSLHTGQMQYIAKLRTGRALSS
jgi:uncharacterized damage-inducible protein DinB